MGRRRDKLQGSRRRQVLQLEDTDGRDSFLAQYGYNARYGEDEEEDMGDNVPMFKQHGHVFEESMDCDSDERNPDTEEDMRSAIDFKTNGGSHSEGQQEGKKIDSELANFMAEIEAISSVAPPPPDTVEDDGQGTRERTSPDRENSPEPSAKSEEKAADNDVVYLDEPVTSWQQCLDENTECYYYWHVDTNEVTWEIPPGYTQFMLQFKAFEEKVLALEQAGKKVKINGPSAGHSGKDQAQKGAEDEEESHVYGPFLPEKSPENASKPGSGVGEGAKGSNSSVSVVQGSGKLLSADYYDSDDGSEEEGDKESKHTVQTAEAEDEDLDFDIDDIDRELELALERKQAEVKSSTKGSEAESKKAALSAKINSLIADKAEPVAAESSQSVTVTEQVAPINVPIIPDKVTLESAVPVQDSTDVVSSGDALKDSTDRLKTNSSKLGADFKADIEEKDRNFKKLIEVKDDRSSSERREKKSEDRYERKVSREERRSSKEDKRSDRKSDRKEDRKSEHRDKRKKDDRKEEKKSHRHKHSKGESSSKEKSKHGPDYKRSLSDQEEGDSDDRRSHRKRSKHKHKDKEHSQPEVVTAEPRPATPTVQPTNVLPPKPERAPVPVKDEDKTIKENIVEISETVMGKLQFLEVVKEGLSGLQMLLISLETRIQDWEAGGLTSQYLIQKLQDASDQLLKYEDSAAPPGWSTHWDSLLLKTNPEQTHAMLTTVGLFTFSRPQFISAFLFVLAGVHLCRSYRRYFYTNVLTGDSQWDYPDLDTEAPASEAQDGRVPQNGQAMDTDAAPEPAIKDSIPDSKSGDTDKTSAGDQERRVPDIPLTVHPGEPPPPGTELGVEELTPAPVEPGSYDVSPAHSIDMEEMEDVEAEDPAPTDKVVISRPPLLLGGEAGDPVPTPAAGSLPASVTSEEEPPPAPLPVPEPGVGNSLPEAPPTGEGDRAAQDPNSSHHRDKEKKKKKDKSISSTSLSLKKKKVSSLVQKWQQVQQEVEREEQTTKERESYLNRYSP